MGTLAVATLFSATVHATASVTRDMFPANADYMGFMIEPDHVTPLDKKIIELVPEFSGPKQLKEYSEMSPIVKRIIDAAEINLTDPADPYLKNLVQSLAIAMKVDVPKERFGILLTLTGNFNTLGLTNAIYTEATEALKKDAEVAKKIALKQVANGLTGSFKVSDDDDKQAYDFSLTAKGKALTLSIGDYTKAFTPIAADSAFAAKLPTDRSRGFAYGIASDLQRTLITNGVLPLDPEIEFPAQFSAQIHALTRLIKIEEFVSEGPEAITYKLLITAGSIDDAKSLLSTLTMFKGMGMMAAASGDPDTSVIAIAMLNAITLTQPEGKSEIIASFKFDIPLITLLINYAETLENAGNGPCDCEDGCDCDDCKCEDCKCTDDDEDEAVDLDALFND